MNVLSRILTPTLLTAMLCQPAFAQDGEDRGHPTKTFRQDSLEAVRLARTIDSLYQHERYDEALALIDKSITFFEKLGFINQVTHALIRKGGIYRSNGDYARALGLFTIALDNYRNLGDRKGEASVMNHIGAVYRLQGNYPTALEYYFKALAGYQAIDYKPGVSSILNNIGIVYQYQKDYDKALDYYTRSLRIEEELQDEEGIGISNLNIGGVYQKKKEYQRAIDYYLKALVYAKKENDPDAIGVIYNEIGAIYIEQGNLSEVKGFLDKAHRAFTGLGSKFRVAECELNYGKYFAAMKNTREAIRHFEQALALSKETGSMEIYMEAHRNLSLLHETLNRPHEAFNHFKAYIAVRDSIHNDENTKKSVQAEMLYQFERQQEQMRIEQAKRDAQIAEKVQRQRVFRNLLLVILLLAVVLTGFVLVSNRTKQRINAQLELQQKEILEKNEELLQQQEEILAQRDEIEKKNLVLERSRQIIVAKNERMVSSIEYAQTIQQAILPSEDVFKKSFNDYFIIYMPKDIVSGDFYWANRINHLLFAAVIDCTGHGVPGSFMSMIGNTLLNQIVNE